LRSPYSSTLFINASATARARTAIGLSSPSGSATVLTCRTSSSAAAITCIVEPAPGPAPPDVGSLEGDPEPGGLGLEEPSCGLPQLRSPKLGSVDEYPDVLPEMVTLGADISGAD
jgi:hypothetical protein